MHCFRILDDIDREWRPAIYYDRYKQSLNSELGSHKAYEKAIRQPCSYSVSHWINDSVSNAFLPYRYRYENYVFFMRSISMVAYFNDQINKNETNSAYHS